MNDVFTTIDGTPNLLIVKKALAEKIKEKFKQFDLEKLRSQSISKAKKNK